MKIIDLLQEIEEILDSAGGFPLTGKVIVDPDDISDILKEIREELPEEIQQAQWIKNERQRILDDAKAEYDRLVNAAREKADQLVENDDITHRAKRRADEIMHTTEENVIRLQRGSYEYIDEAFASFQKKLNELNANYCQKMYEDMTTMFQRMDVTIGQNRAEIASLAERLGPRGHREQVPGYGPEYSEMAETDPAEQEPLSLPPDED